MSQQGSGPRGRRFIGALLLLAVTLVASVFDLQRALAGSASPLPNRLGRAAFTSLESFPARVSHRYSMTAKVRLLFFWAGKDDVGGGRIVWRTEGRLRTYQLLIGSDPRRAPRRINRWGYAQEQISEEESSFLGIMKSSEGESAQDAAERLAREAREGTHLFKGIESTVARESAVSRVTYYALQEEFSYRDLESLLQLAQSGLPDAREVFHHLEGPPADRPLGFLAAVDELIQMTIRAGADPAFSGQYRDKPRLVYVYNATVYRLSLERVRRREEYEVRFRRSGESGPVRETYPELLHSYFRVENQRTGEVTRFELIYGASGPLAGVPVVIIYQPKWWFQVVLHLDDRAKGPDPF